MTRTEDILSGMFNEAHRSGIFGYEPNLLLGFMNRSAAYAIDLHTGESYISVRLFSVNHMTETQSSISDTGLIDDCNDDLGSEWGFHYDCVEYYFMSIFVFYVQKNHDIAKVILEAGIHKEIIHRGSSEFEFIQRLIEVNAL